MEKEEVNKIVDDALHRPHSKKKERDRFYSLRNILNIVFMIVAIIGVIIYCIKGYETIGTVVILIAMVIKMVECSLRFIH